MSNARWLLALIFASMAGAQTTSTVTGLVTDQTKAVIPGARVVLQAVETGVEYKTLTNADGYYTLPSLPALNFVVHADAPGLKRATSTAFKLDSAAVARIDLMLVPEDAKQSVEVTAAAPAINTESGMLGTTVSSKEISDLPVQGRNALELVTTVAGVGGEMARDEMELSLRPMSPGSGVSIGGGRLSTTSYMVDGSATSGVAYGRATVTLSTDTVQELKVITNNYSAQYGSVGSGVVSMVSKSGTDQLHGSAFWSQKNPALGARAFNASAVPRSRRNEFGTTLGGPVYIPKLYDGRHKTFFFVSVEPKRYSNESDYRTWTPTAADRQGDLRDRYVLPNAPRPLIYQQVECAPSSANCAQLEPTKRPASGIYPLWGLGDGDPTKVGHVIPKQYIDKTAQLILSYVPLPNMPYDSVGNNFLGIQGNDGRDNRSNYKVDHVVNPKHRLTGRYTDIPIGSNNFQWVRGPEPTAYPSHISHTKQPFVSESWTISPRIVNEVRLAYTYGNYSDIAPYDIQTKDYTKDVFHLPSNANWGHPSFTVQSTGVPGANWGLRDGENIGFTKEHQYQIADDLTMVLGKHTITTGVDLRHQHLNIIGNGLQRIAGGSYLFQTNVTQAGNANAPGGQGGDTFASFLLGIPGTMTIRSAVIPYYYLWKTYGAYLQDDYKIRRNLTFNLGLRYQYNSPRSEKYGRQASIDLDNPVALKDAAGRTNGYTFNYQYAGFGGSDYLEPAHKNGFEPRLGFAWTPDFNWNRGKRMVVRGGYGISHMPQTGRSRFAIPDFGAAVNSHSYVQWTGTTAPINEAVNPVLPIRMSSNPPTVAPTPALLDIPKDGKLCAGCPPVDARVPGGSLVAFNKNNQLPYLQSWNLTMQKELPSSLVLTLSYFGSKGTHLFSPGLNVNAPDQTKIGALLDQGLDPLQNVTDPFGRVDAAGSVRTVTLQDLARPYPTVGDVVVAGVTTSNSVFHAGSAEIERRFAKGIGFRFNYTWSKSIDNTSDSNYDGTSFGSFGSSLWQDVTDAKGNRSVSIYDARHRFNYTTNIELPVGKGKPILGNSGRLLNTLIGGWQVNAIGTLVSGYPFQPNMGDRNGFAAQPTGGIVNERIRPDMVPGVPLVNPLWNKSVANDVPYFNPAAFARPGYARKGNAPRTLDYARGPWRPGLNSSIMKNFYPFESRSRYVQFRGEFYNVLNHAVFSPAVSSALFTGTPPVSRTGQSLAGPIPYYPGLKPGAYPTNSREEVLSRYYNPAFGMIPFGSNGAGRTIQFMLRLAW